MNNEVIYIVIYRFMVTTSCGHVVDTLPAFSGLQYLL